MFRIFNVCGDPESGTDHSQKEVSACLIWLRARYRVLQGDKFVVLVILLDIRSIFYSSYTREGFKCQRHLSYSKLVHYFSLSYSK